MVLLTYETRLAVFPTGTIVRDPHHRESPTLREQDVTFANLIFSGEIVRVTDSLKIFSSGILGVYTQM